MTTRQVIKTSLRLKIQSFALHILRIWLTLFNLILIVYVYIAIEYSAVMRVVWPPSQLGTVYRSCKYHSLSLSFTASTVVLILYGK